MYFKCILELIVIILETLLYWNASGIFFFFLHFSVFQLPFFTLVNFCLLVLLLNILICVSLIVAE